MTLLVDGNQFGIARIDRYGPSVSAGFSSNRDSILDAIHANLQVAVGGILPAILGLPGRDSRHGGAFSARGTRLSAIGQIVGHDLGVSGAQVGHVGRLTALLKLGGEHGDGDGHQYGPWGPYRRSKMQKRGGCIL